jgi:hypothetical protein
MTDNRRSSWAAHAWMRSGDISFWVCVALRLLRMTRATPTTVIQPYVGNQSPHVAWSPTRRKNGHLHACKAGFACRGWDYGRGGRIDAGHGHLHIVEDPMFTHKRRALLPSIGSKPAVIAHDQYPSRKTAFPTSHAGARVSILEYTNRCSMGAPEISRTKVKFNVLLISI